MNTIKKLRTVVYLMVAVLLAASCSDDEGPSVKNTITMDGSSFNVIAVTLIGVSIDNEGHAAVSFTSVQNNITKTLTVDFEYSPLQSLDGTYAYPQTSSTRFLDDFLSYYAEFDGSTEVSSTNLDTGTFTLKSNGNSNYTFTLDVKMLDGTVFKGSYTGPVDAAFNNG